VMVHRQIIAFMNSVMVEEQRYLNLNSSQHSNEKITLLLDNPTLSDDNYTKNMAILFEKKAVAPLYSYIVSCPIWQPFLSLQHRKEIEKLVKEYPESSLSQSLLLSKEIGTSEEFDSDTGLYDLLNLIPPARSSNLTTPTLWRHEFLISDVLTNEKIKHALKSLLSEFEKSDRKDKSDKAFVLEHLARTSNAEIEAVIRKLRPETKK